jgi:hypothetical protein
MRGCPSDTLIAAYWDFNVTYFIRIVQYRPGVSTLLIGSISLTTYGYSDPRDVCVNLSEITVTNAGAIQPGLAVTIHPRVGSTVVPAAANCDGFYAIATAGYFTAASLVTIADGDWPTNTPAKAITGPIVQLNNVHYILTTDGFIHGSYPSDTGPYFLPQIDVWDAVGVTTASQDSDRGVTLVKYKHHLVAFGSSTMEFFNDEGQAKPGLPIMRTQQAYIKVGCVNPKAVTVVGDNLYWVGTSLELANIGLYRLSGYTPELLTSPGMQTLLGNNYGRVSAELYPFYTQGTTHIITNVQVNPQINTSLMGSDQPDNLKLEGNLCYAVESKAWWVWTHEWGITTWKSDVLTNGNGVTPILRCATTIADGYVVRWIWCCAYNSGLTESLGMHPIRLWQVGEAQDLAYYDNLRVNNSASYYAFRVPVAVRTNRLQFGALNRKTLHKMRLGWRYIKGNGTFLPAEAWFLYVNAWKDLATEQMAYNSTPNISRSIDL